MIPQSIVNPLEWVEHDEEAYVLFGRILAFTGWSVADVLRNPVARNEVRHYMRVSRLIERRGEVLDLEAQWNPTGKQL